MRVVSILKAGILGGLISASTVSCKKSPVQKFVKTEAPFDLSRRLDFIKSETSRVMRDKRYEFFAYDTIKVSDDIKYLRSYLSILNKQAQRYSPKIKTGQHLETQMVPKSGGGFDIVPVVRNEYTPRYIEAKTVIKSNEIFSKGDDEFYVPVEYYGIPNPKLK